MTRTITLGRIAVACTVVGTVFGCGNDNGSGSGLLGPPPPSGACHTGGTATGSFNAACTPCAQQYCNAELNDKSGSGWPNQYFGGDGTCKAYNGCLCSCFATAGSDPLTCATSTCFGQFDAACQAAVRAADTCISTHCQAECR